jgi:hypothetical protein
VAKKREDWLWHLRTPSLWQMQILLAGLRDTGSLR